MRRTYINNVHNIIWEACIETELWQNKKRRTIDRKKRGCSTIPPSGLQVWITYHHLLHLQRLCFYRHKLLFLSHKATWLDMVWRRWNRNRIWKHRIRHSNLTNKASYICGQWRRIECDLLFFLNSYFFNPSYVAFWLGMNPSFVHITYYTQHELYFFFLWKKKNYTFLWLSMLISL